MQGSNFRNLDGKSFWASDENYILLYPKVHPLRCNPHIYVWRDFSRVYVDGTGFDFREVAREADDVEIQALAERFGSDVLQKVLAYRSLRPAPNGA